MHENVDQLNMAQVINRTLTGCLEHAGADPILATKQTMEMMWRYRAPHAYRPTPPKEHYKRSTRKRAVCNH